ncbi:MAG: STAS domain-containing protein, partial [Burkholderiaceae bacterium]|nr:STAS domain-containing protein [Burkholderiaceae bacterium]
GLNIAKMPGHFFGQIDAIARHLTSVNLTAMALAGASLALIIVWPKSYAPNDAHWRRWMAHLPGTVVVIVLGTLAVSLFGLDVETIGSRFGGIPRGLPPFALPDLEWETMRNLSGPIISIALLGAIESLLCARVADTLIDDRHDPNQELMAQGVANFVVPFFGGIAATGTIARTVTNIRSGARTPVAGIIHSATLMAIVLLLAPLARDIPMAVLAAILMFVAYNMGDWRAFARLRQFSLMYRTIMLATFLLTVALDLTVAIEIGLVLSSLFFIYRVSTLTRVEPVRLPSDIAQSADGRKIRAYRVFGSLFFGSVDKIEQLMDPAMGNGLVVVLEMHQVINLDTTGLDALQGLLRMLRKRDGRLILAEPTEQPLSLLRRSGFLDELGRDNVFGDFEAALAAARAPSAASDVVK